MGDEILFGHAIQAGFRGVVYDGNEFEGVGFVLRAEFCKDFGVGVMGADGVVNVEHFGGFYVQGADGVGVQVDGAGNHALHNFSPLLFEFLGFARCKLIYSLLIVYYVFNECL